MAVCCFSPRGDLQTFGHLSQGNPPKVGGMIGEDDRRYTSPAGTPQMQIGTTCGQHVLLSQPTAFSSNLLNPLGSLFLHSIHSEPGPGGHDQLSRSTCVAVLDVWLRWACLHPERYKTVRAATHLSLPPSIHSYYHFTYHLH